LHGIGLVHRDLKLQNVLLGTDNHLKIADFGFAKPLKAGSVLSSVKGNPFPMFVLPHRSDIIKSLCLFFTFKGTPIYMAPEMILEQPYTSAVDLWALGVMFYEVL
ncbi:kinase-like domain-containing protein, partial [Cladochytrium replicatum]